MLTFEGSLNAVLGGVGPPERSTASLPEKTKVPKALREEPKATGQQILGAHKQKDPTFWLQGSGLGGFQIPWFVGSLC